jgi:hypothetical protein
LLLSIQLAGVVGLPKVKVDSKTWGGQVKLIHVCYVALGFAVARMLFKRQPVPELDLVNRFRTSGLL